jgi:hypothetical protein
MADKFNIFFTNVAFTIAQTIVPTDRPPDIPEQYIPDESLFSLAHDPVSLSDVSDAIGSLEPKKTLDCNSLSVSVLRNFALTLSRQLHHIISVSFLTGIIPIQSYFELLIRFSKSTFDFTPPN